MSPSKPFIERPVATGLLMLAIVLAGLVGLRFLPLAALPQVDYPTIQVQTLYPGGSPDIPSSRDRVQGYTKQLRDEFGVAIVDSIDALLERVDVVFLESVDGRPHLEQARPVFRARKPVFIDKPVAGSLADAIEIFRLARESGTPCFSASSLRFSPAIVEMNDVVGIRDRLDAVRDDDDRSARHGCGHVRA